MKVHYNSDSYRSGVKWVTVILKSFNSPSLISHLTKRTCEQHKAEVEGGGECITNPGPNHWDVAL